VIHADLDAQLAAAVPIVREAGQLALRYFRERDSLAIEHKGHQDLVSIADRSVEDLLRERLATAFPGDAVLGEEGGGSDDAARTWVLDPIDGTFNFLKGIPCWGVVAALVIDGELAIGLTYDPVHDEMFTARRGGGAQRNGTPIKVSGNQGVDTSCLALAYTFKQSSTAAAARLRSSSAGSPTAVATRSSRSTARPGTASPA
jgi:myo-inositol-1(or 4)-monophosphatase